MLEKTLESPLDCKEIQPIHPKGDQSWVFFGRTDAEAETPTLWPTNVKNWPIGKDPDAEKDWRQKEKGTTEDEMVRWHHWLNWTWVWISSGNCDVQRSLVCCSPWGHKESDTTELLNWTDTYRLNLKRLNYSTTTSNLWIKFHLWSRNRRHFRDISTHFIWRFFLSRPSCIERKIEWSFHGAIYKVDQKGSHKKHFSADILKILHPIAYLTLSDDAEY